MGQIADKFAEDAGEVQSKIAIPVYDALVAIEEKLSFLETAPKPGTIAQQQQSIYELQKFVDLLLRRSDIEPSEYPQFPATPQPVRIRPDDMVMVKWYNEKEPRKMQFDSINLENNLLEYISPTQPVRREWMKVPKDDDFVWGYFPTIFGKMIVKKVKFSTLRVTDKFTSVLSPEEPAPEVPCEVE